LVAKLGHPLAHEGIIDRVIPIHSPSAYDGPWTDD
jgi:hypothetical protein